MAVLSEPRRRKYQPGGFQLFQIMVSPALCVRFRWLVLTSLTSHGTDSILLDAGSPPGQPLNLAVRPATSANVLPSSLVGTSGGTNRHSEPRYRVLVGGGQRGPTTPVPALSSDANASLSYNLGTGTPPPSLILAPSPPNERSLCGISFNPLRGLWIVASGLALGRYTRGRHAIRVQHWEEFGVILLGFHCMSQQRGMAIHNTSSVRCRIYSDR